MHSCNDPLTTNHGAEVEPFAPLVMIRKMFSRSPEERPKRGDSIWKLYSGIFKIRILFCSRNFC
uniref:Uncharacterized protein n=1 Tax=Manihot esculenta TaxID=3983 RepID=A0A2C9UWD1_MANES